ncbi:protein CURVATURE THYLAKOID 1B, chloroplastic-like [Curcuma longa]|uniref:protein CURVATURE THYLAKOID 1B, chloroplastic-like n=1 Tax=Curcuma longa TaxID=136217 RepID=UPI003D9DC01A
MAASSAPCGLTSRALLDPSATATRGQFGPRAVRLPMLSIVSRKNASCCSGTATGSVVAKATGETPAQVSSELPEIVTTVKEEWQKLDDKYAVASLAFAGIIALWSSTGIISAIDKLPIIPGVLELIGIGYTGWFVYNNLIYKPDREALIERVKSTYGDVIGKSS